MIAKLKWKDNDVFHSAETAVGNASIYRKGHNKFCLYRAIPIFGGDVVSLKYRMPEFETLKEAKDAVWAMHKAFIQRFLTPIKKVKKS